MSGIAQCRANGIRHSLVQHLFSNSLLCQVRASSLSAIHRGVRQTQRAQRVQHDDPISAALAKNRRGSEWDRRGRLTAKALGGVSSQRQAQKLRKKLEAKAEKKSRRGEKGEDEMRGAKAGEEAGQEEGRRMRQTRRSRFLDPNRSFGKDSLVYQLKHGVLKDEAASLKLRRPAQPAPFRSLKPEKGQRLSQAAALEQAIWGKPAVKPERVPLSERSGRREQPRASERMRDRPSEDGRRERTYNSGGFGTEERHTGLHPSSRTKVSDAKPGFATQGRRARNRMPSRSQEGDDDAHHGGRERDAPFVSIKYTTAASQFLYGKSVVRAALEQPRRKLYNLYIYAGDTRRDSREDATIASAAERRGVPVTMVPPGDQAMMDRMSGGRPHNGFVLEASPLQQPPIASLGRLEESLGRLGFHVELGHQSREDEAINGLETFVARKSDATPKPLVLFLHEILDPGNLGGLLRTASYLGVDAVVMTNRSSSTLTPVVLKSAAGAAEEVRIFTVASPVDFIERSRRAGWETYAAVAPPDSKLARIHEDKFLSTDALERRAPLFKNPCMLILGNEGHGLSKQVKVAADYELSIPRFVQHSAVDSLNVSVAAGLLCHAFLKAPVSRDGARESRPRKSSTNKMAEGEGEARSGESLF